MTGLDVLFWASLFLGGSYLLLSVALGGLSDLASHIGGALGAGDAGDIGHVGDVGHADGGADFGHADGGADFGHADGGADFGHADGGADFGHADGGAETHTGDPEASHHDGTDTPAGLKLLSFLSPVLASGFFVGFGGAGVLARMAKLPLVPSAAWAAAGGAAMYYLAWWIVHDVFGGSQASSHTRRDELTGRTGVVIAPITGVQPGMISYTIAGTRQSIPAISDDGAPIPVGVSVRIRRVDGKRAIVIRAVSDQGTRAHVKGAGDV